MERAFLMKKAIDSLKGCGGCARRREWLLKQKRRLQQHMRNIAEPSPIPEPEKDDEPIDPQA